LNRNLSSIPASIDAICRSSTRAFGVALIWLLTPVVGLFAIGYLITRVQYFELDSLILSKLLEWGIVLIIIALLGRYNSCAKRSGLNWISRVRRILAFLAGYFVFVVTIFGSSVLLLGVGQGPLIPLAAIVQIFNIPFVFALEIALLFVLLYAASPSSDIRQKRPSPMQNLTDLA